jgi:hypothetical protein
MVELSFKLTLKRLNMDNDTQELLKLTPNQLHNTLIKRGLPIDLRIATTNHIEALKKERRRKKIKQTTHENLWARLFKPLKYELNNARVGLRLKKTEAAPERYAAFDAYIQVMEKLLAGMEKFQMDGQYTPASIAKARGFPNNGEHWTDWVSDKTKMRIQEMFFSIPHIARAKRFEPFNRRLPPELYRVEYRRLLIRSLKEYDLLLSELLVVRDTDRQDELKEQRFKMEYALSNLRLLKAGSALPTTWHGATAGFEAWRGTMDASDAAARFVFDTPQYLRTVLERLIEQDEADQRIKDLEKELREKSL